MRHQLGGDEEAHLRRRGVEREHGGERQREQRHLVAEHRDRLRGPELQELGLAEERRRLGGRRRRSLIRQTHARLMLMSPLMERAFSSTSGPSSVSSVPPDSRSQLGRGVARERLCVDQEPRPLGDPDLDVARGRVDPYVAGYHAVDRDVARGRVHVGALRRLVDPDVARGRVDLGPADVVEPTSPDAALTPASPDTSSNSTSPDATLTSSSE